MDRRSLILAAALALSPLLAACTPDTPETELTWNADEHVKHYPAEGPKYVAQDTARTYVYQGDNYAVPAPKPRPAPPAYTPPVDNGHADSYVDNHDNHGFAWPLNGPVISGFGATTNGERNDGINIAAATGAPIHASAAGTVTYASDELKAYGNLVLIRHADGYVTAYAHADRLVVAKGDVVSKGQVIGYAGSTGDVTSPQLHFEIRHDTTPLNPKSLLVARNS